MRSWRVLAVLVLLALALTGVASAADLATLRQTPTLPTYDLWLLPCEEKGATCKYPEQAKQLGVTIGTPLAEVREWRSKGERVYVDGRRLQEGEQYPKRFVFAHGLFRPGEPLERCYCTRKLTPFSSETNYMSLKGYHRWRFGQKRGER